MAKLPLGPVARFGVFCYIGEAASQYRQIEQATAILLLTEMSVGATPLRGIQSTWNYVMKNMYLVYNCNQWHYSIKHSYYFDPEFHITGIFRS